MVYEPRFDAELEWEVCLDLFMNFADEMATLIQMFMSYEPFDTRQGVSYVGSAPF